MDAIKNFGQRAPFKRTDTSDHIKKADSKAYGVHSSTEEMDLPAYSNNEEGRRASVASYNISGIHDDTHRKLKPRHIQLIGIGGTIGTALYVQIGRGLLNGGPGALFLAFSFWYVLINM
jgi:amino acid transporter